MGDPRTQVLIVDDDPLIRSTCKTYLEERGYFILTAENGRDALRQLRDTRVDVVFLDILMPDKDGIETLLEIKNGPTSPRVYVMSGGGKARMYSFLDIAMTFGADGMLRKPFHPEDLVKLLQEPRKQKPLPKAAT